MNKFSGPSYCKKEIIHINFRKIKIIWTLDMKHDRFLNVILEETKKTREDLDYLNIDSSFAIYFKNMMSWWTIKISAVTYLNLKTPYVRT